MGRFFCSHIPLYSIVFHRKMLWELTCNYVDYAEKVLKYKCFTWNNRAYYPNFHPKQGKKGAVQPFFSPQYAPSFSAAVVPASEVYAAYMSSVIAALAWPRLCWTVFGSAPATRAATA